MLAKRKLDSIETLVPQALIEWKWVMKNLMRLLVISENHKCERMIEMWGMSMKSKKIWDWIVWIQEK